MKTRHVEQARNVPTRLMRVYVNVECLYPVESVARVSFSTCGLDLLLEYFAVVGTAAVYCPPANMRSFVAK